MTCINNLFKHYDMMLLFILFALLNTILLHEITSRSKTLICKVVVGVDVYVEEHREKGVGWDENSRKWGLGKGETFGM